MAFFTQNVTIVGNLVDDPELRFTPNGVAVAKLQVVTKQQKYDKATSKWVDGDVWFARVTVWRQQGENCAESLKKGSRVLCVGHIAQSSYEAKDGSGKRYSVDLIADVVAASLEWDPVKITKLQRSSGFGAAAEDDQWSTSTTASEPIDDEPPF